MMQFFQSHLDQLLHACLRRLTGHGARRLALAVAQNHQRGHRFGHIAGAGSDLLTDRADLLQLFAELLVFDLIPQLQQDALRQLFADARRAGQALDVLRHQAEHQLVGFEFGQNPQRHLWSHAADRSQLPEAALLGQGGKAEQVHSSLTDI